MPQCRKLLHPDCVARGGEWPTEDDFKKNPYQPFSSICKSCNKHAAKQWRDGNKDRVRAWRADNRHRIKTRLRERALRIRIASTLTEHEWQDILGKYDHKCLACGTDKDITKDHVIPLVKGGTDTASNVQPLCRPCNSSKGDKEVDYR